MDGTGLTAAGSVDGQLLFPLLQSVPYDALGIGNHELYKSSTVLDGSSSCAAGTALFARMRSTTRCTFGRATINCGIHKPAGQ